MSEEPQVETLETPSDHFTLAQEEEDSDMTADNIDQTSHLFLPFVKKPPTLEEALAPMGYEEPKNLAKSLITNAKEKQEEMDAPGLTVEDIAAIMCYTLEWDKERFGNAESPYRILNDSLSVNRRKGGIKKIRGFLFLLLQALRKLPRYIPKNHTLYRGIRTRVQTEVDPNFPERRPYAAGNEKTWWAFTSTTVKLDVTQLFLGRDMCTLFIVCGKPWGYDVSTFSNFPEEKEILLEPERRFRITNVIREGGLTTINATMLDTPLALETIIKVPKRLKDVKLKKIKIKEIPEGLKVEEDEDQSIKVSWSPVVVKKKTILYQLSMKKLGGLGNSTIIAYEGTEVECVIKKPEPERTYEFQVRCGYNGSLGKWSEKVSVKTKSTVSSEASPKPSSETNQEAEDKKNLVLVKLALMIMDSNKDSVDLEMYNTTMAFAIQVMNGHDENIPTIVEAKGIEIAIRGLVEHFNNTDVCERGCCALALMTNGNTENQKRAGDMGGVEVTIKVLNAQITTVDACGLGLGALGALTIRNPENQARAIAAGGIELVLKAINLHMDNASVCGIGIDAIIGMRLNSDIQQATPTTDSQQTTGKSNPTAITVEEIETVINAMRTHINAPGVCHSGCKAIAIFTFASLHREVYERGGLKVLYDVLRAHINNKDITELCIQVILLFKSVPEANEEILSSESMALLLVALTNCGGDTEEMKSQFNITRNEN